MPDYAMKHLSFEEQGSKETKVMHATVVPVSLRKEGSADKGRQTKWTIEQLLMQLDMQAGPDYMKTE